MVLVSGEEVKLLRFALILLCLATSAQTPEPNAIQRAHEAYNSFANAANAWTVQHNDFIWSREDHQRLERARAAWKTFDRLAKEAQF